MPNTIFRDSGRLDAAASSPQHHVIRLRGSLGRDEGELLLDALRSGSPGRGSSVIVDLSRVTAINREGAMALLDAYVATTLRRCRLSLAGVTSTCRGVLQRTNVLRVVMLFPQPAVTR
jgi:anti-anti-sigma regulatory factor